MISSCHPKSAAWRSLTILILSVMPFINGSAAVTFPKDQIAYVVAGSNIKLTQRIIARLTDYLSAVTGKPASIVVDLKEVPANFPAIILSSENLTNSPEAFALETGSQAGHAAVFASGHTEAGLKRAIQRLIIKSEQETNGLVMPDLKVSESPWIPRREWTLCGWAPDHVRGIFENPNADRRPNVWLYSDEQISKYVEMFDSFGFSGCQLHDTVGNYPTLGSAEAYHDRLRKFATDVRDNGQQVTLWVWAAQFNGFGWNDPSVTYTPAAGETAFDDPKVRMTFEKYYDSYAQLASNVDLVIAHFYDPGALKNRADVFRYMRLLFSKFQAQNPRVELGVDFWASGSEQDYMQQLIDNGFGNALLLETSMPSFWPTGKREKLHEEAKKLGLQLGVWGWHTAEIETDQSPLMHVNAELLSHFYRQMRDGVCRIQPITYWSEMEAYHLNNIFTMYCCGQLLWNPDRDPDEILGEIAGGIWGPHNGRGMFEALKLIQDVRTGPTWETYWPSRPQYRLGTEDPKEDLQRADRAIASLEKLQVDPGFVTKFPMPFPPATFVELTLPHLRQIKCFAEFRIVFADLEELARHGATKAELTRQAEAIWKPIPEYNTWIGAFGNAETYRQEKMLTSFAKEHDITITPLGWLRWRDANRLLEGIQNQQRASTNVWQFDSDNTRLWGMFFWSKDKGRERLQLLIDNGCVTKNTDGHFQLANWQEFKSP